MQQDFQRTPKKKKRKKKRALLSQAYYSRKTQIQTKKHRRKLNFLRQFLCISQPKAITPLHVYDVPRTGLAQTH